MGLEEPEGTQNCLPRKPYPVTHTPRHGTSDTNTGSMHVSIHACEHIYTSPPYMPGRPLAHHCFHHSTHLSLIYPFIYPSETAPQEMEHRR